jgi:DUF2075 family protein
LENTFDIVIGDVKLKWNSVSDDWINTENSVNEVGCIHTTQGYDLNYTGIIFGNEISYDKLNNQIIIQNIFIIFYYFIGFIIFSFEFYFFQFKKFIITIHLILDLL